MLIHIFNKLFFTLINNNLKKLTLYLFFSQYFTLFFYVTAIINYYLSVMCTLKNNYKYNSENKKFNLSFIYYCEVHETSISFLSF